MHVYLCLSGGEKMRKSKIEKVKLATVLMMTTVLIPHMAYAAENTEDNSSTMNETSVETNIETEIENEETTQQNEQTPTDEEENNVNPEENTDTERMKRRQFIKVILPINQVKLQFSQKSKSLWMKTVKSQQRKIL